MPGDAGSSSVSVRPYDPEADRAALWALKAAFETALGDAGGDAKAETYAAKLSDAYRARWLAWVDRCVAARADCVTVAEARPGGDGNNVGEVDAGPGGDDSADGGPTLVGYVFVLPERLAFVWDAAVVNELYLAPAYRGTGVADDLMTAAVDVARRQDLPLDRLLLDVDPENARAAAFYDRHGFEPWGEIVARPLGED
jgi:ribosomal protein S18 acetylase RimI-like enzyme